MFDELDVSVVVPTYNRATLLVPLLEALIKQDYSGTYEVIVVDDGSDDETPALLAEWQARHPGRLRCYRQQNAGPARARNRGAHEANGRLLAFIDDDCVPEPDWLRRLKACHARSGAAAVAGAVINRESTWIGRYINRESVIAHVIAADGSVEQWITGNAGVARARFLELGGFDETIRVAGGEDTEFSLRLRSSGYTIASAPEARVYHQSWVTLPEYLRMIHRHGRGRRRLAERFPEYRLSFPALRLAWLCWPLRRWIVQDWHRYRLASVGRAETLRYLALRYLENLARMLGYLRGAS